MSNSSGKQHNEPTIRTNDVGGAIPTGLFNVPLLNPRVEPHLQSNTRHRTRPAEPSQGSLTFEGGWTFTSLTASKV